jgi:hypothetical protein
MRTDPTIDDVAFVTSCLVALGGDRHAEAVASLRSVSEVATIQRSSTAKVGANQPTVGGRQAQRRAS